MPSDAADRAAARATWPGGLHTTQRPAQLPTAAERLASMWPLAQDAWALLGLELPVYARHEMPGRVIRS